MTTAGDHPRGAQAAISERSTLFGKLPSTLAAALLFSFSPAPTAAADTKVDTPVTLTVIGGALQITVDPAPKESGGTQVASTVRRRLGQVTVSDQRNAPAGSSWVASVTVTNFEPTRGRAISAALLSYQVGDIRKVGTATHKALNPRNLRKASPVVKAEDVEGNNTASWTPTIVVDIPSGITAGVYTATVTHSVA